MFCQSCGANNATDARFCNMCGQKIARIGEPGGPIATAPVAVPAPAAPAPEPAPPAHYVQTVAPRGTTPEATSGELEQAAAARVRESAWDVASGPSSGERSMAGASAPIARNPAHDTASISLAGIGVQSSGRAWGMLVLGGLLLVGLGAGGMYFAMKPTGTETPIAPPPTPQPFATVDASTGQPVEIGTPIPNGVDMPQIDFVSGGPRVPSGEPVAANTPTQPATTGGTTPRTQTGGTHRRVPNNSGTQSGSGTSTGTGTGSGSGSGSETGSGSGSETGSGSVSSETGTGTAETGTGTGESGTGTGTGTGAGGEGDMPEERDIALEMYVGRVRYVMSRYYMARAQSCFDHATRNDPTVRGTVTIGFTIGTEGTITRTSVERNTTGNEALGGCLSAQVQSWRLPPPPSELDLEVPFSR